MLRSLASVPGVTVPEPQGAFYAFPRIDGLTDSATFCADLLRLTGLAAAPGAAFGPAGEGSIRFCFASTEATLEDAMDRFHRFMSNHHEWPVALDSRGRT
jgi:aspartate/methionine/tyrosine aminotransferase